MLVKAGITCYWQTRKNRDAITFDEWVDFDLWYNNFRMHSTLGCMSPVEFRKAGLAL